MRTALLVFAALLLVACGSSKQVRPQTNLKDVNGQPFSGPRFGLKFPTGWDVRENVAYTNVIAVAPLQDEDPLTESVSVVLENLRSRLSARDYLEVGIPVMERVLNEFEVVEKAELKLPSGLRAATLQYRHVVNNVKVESVALYVVSGSAGYVVTGIADVGHFPSYVETFTDVFQTFELDE